MIWNSDLLEREFWVGQIEYKQSFQAEDSVIFTKNNLTFREKKIMMFFSKCSSISLNFPNVKLLELTWVLDCDIMDVQFNFM